MTAKTEEKNEGKDLAAKPPAPMNPSVAAVAKAEKGWVNFWGKGVFPEQEELDQMLKLCGYLIKAQLVPEGLNSPDKLMVVFLNAREMGIPPMTAVKGMYPVKGKVALEGWLALALIRTRVPEAMIDFVKVTDKEVVIHAWRPGMPKEKWEEFSFTWADAETAKLTYKKGYTKDGKEYNCSIYPLYPKDMLGWKAVSRMVKKMFSDLTNGCPLREDVQEIIEAEMEETRRLQALSPTSTDAAIPTVTSVPDQLKPTAPPAGAPAQPAAAAPAPPPVATAPTPAAPVPEKEDNWEKTANLTGDEVCTCNHVSFGHVEGCKKCNAPGCPCLGFQFLDDSGSQPGQSDAAEPSDGEILAALESNLKAIPVTDRLNEATASAGKMVLDSPFALRPQALKIFEPMVKAFMDRAKDTSQINLAMTGVPEILRSEELIQYYHINFKHLQKGEKAKPAVGNQ